MSVETERKRPIKFLDPGFDFVQVFRPTSSQALLYFSHFENRREGSGDKFGRSAFGVRELEAKRAMETRMVRTPA